MTPPTNKELTAQVVTMDLEGDGVSLETKKQVQKKKKSSICWGLVINLLIDNAFQLTEASIRIRRKCHGK